MAGPSRREAVRGGREVVPADQAVVLIRRRAVRNQAEQARATSTMLRQRYLRAVAQSLTVCGQAAEAYADAPQRLPGSGQALGRHHRPGRRARMGSTSKG